MNDHHVDEERNEEVDAMSTNPRRSARLGSRSSSCSSTPVLGGAAIVAKIQNLDGAQMNDERAKGNGACVKVEQQQQSSCKEVFACDVVESGCAAGLTARAQDSGASAPDTFPLLAGSPVTISGEVFYEGNDMLVVRVNWRGLEFTGTLIKQGKGQWAPTRMRMMEEGEAEAEISQERAEEPIVRTRKRKGLRGRDKGNGEEKSSPGRPTNRRRGRAARAKKEEEEEEEEHEEGEEEQEVKSKGSEQGDSNGEEYKVSNTTQQSLPSLRSKKRSPDTTPTPTKELMNAYQTSPPDSNKPESPSEQPEYFECPEADCPRKYKHMKSLKHHLACAHQIVRRHNLKRKLLGATGQDSEDEERKTDETMQSPASKKTKSRLSKEHPRKGKMISSQTECGSGNSEKEEHELKNSISEDAKQSRKMKQRQATRGSLKQQVQSEEDDKREDGECGGSGQETPPPMKETTHVGQENKEDTGMKDDMSSIMQQSRFGHTLSFGNNFTVVNSPSGRSLTSVSPLKGSLPAALKISNNQIHGRDGASGDSSEAQQGQGLHQSSLTPAIERITVGRTVANTTTTAQLPTEWSKAFPSARDEGQTMRSNQHSDRHVSPAGGSRSPSNIMRKNRLTSLNNTVADKSPAKADISTATQSKPEPYARLGEAAAAGYKTDNQRMKVEHNLSDFHMSGSPSVSSGVDGHLPRNSSSVFGHLSASKDYQQAIRLNNPRDHPLGMTAFSPFPFFPDMFGGFPNFSNYSLGRDIAFPIGFAGLNAIGPASDLNMRASIAAAELNKARGGNT